ncbi:hypothetical protein [Pseudoalteromonas luteoviolacea]|uniref:Uncharacterized protein n=1 Tax=Pseudoalteromonas luteoviolacea S4054 TaxID=1129367 RepID=A0A0F6ADT9_9GAMM|nr:hypothetical protein [Pseudoalteromonas luteoviolacea]AOT09718.1 hypothetical protein S4054249_18650 [Pseudoalteromonas luteoviolacea]AOT14631.1 hypothetical protein S40542_18620 [Pseudoalteromonas luteoviolacea]AOT19545.1 hypothetical protein S4054_18625 [Pseudoalteromonas luteoviolacea]KKE83986.1 hypothetical protein N479_11275 [Pseudoalteromonas luteoviolacea S4054]KZN77380.1 hypothetical protein N481_04815 [Pseudoalteromonas luteoviolacea S4047-1]
MVNAVTKLRDLDQLAAFFFCFFFVNTIFSLYISGFALWLFVFMPFLSPAFIRSAAYVRRNIFIIIFLGISIAIFSLQIVTALKVVFAYICVTYVMFLLKHREFKWFHFFLVTNVCICVVQFFGYKFLGVKLLDPTFIASLYGDFGLTTGDTFAEGFLLEYRVSGLNREPAFLSSLLLSGLLLVLYQSKYSGKVKRGLSSGSKVLIMFYLLGLCLTFSKVTFFLAMLLPLAYALRKLIKSLGPDVVTILFLLSVSTVVVIFYEFTNIHNFPTSVYHGLSVYHRTIGYYVLYDMNVFDLFLGVRGDIASLAEYLPYIKNSEWWGHDRLIFDNSGLAQLIIEFGFLSVLPFLFFMRIAKVDAFKWCLFLLLTVNVNPLTSTSFVILSLAIVFYNGK